MTTERPLGWLRDPPGAPGYVSGTRMLVGARRSSTLPALPTASHVSVRRERILQGGIGSCWANGLQRGVLSWTRLNGEADLVVSRRAAYWLARCGEHADLGPEGARKATTAAGDVGSYPWLGYQAQRTVGLIPESDCPYPTNPHDPRSIAEVVGVQPPAELFARSYDRRGIETARVAGTGLERVRQVVSLMRERCTVGFGAEVDLAFLRNRGELVHEVNANLVQGGHWMEVLAVVRRMSWEEEVRHRASAEEFFAWVEKNAIDDPAKVDASSELVVDNWWEGFGVADSGVGRIQAGLFGSRWFSDVTALRFVPAEAPAEPTL